MLRCELSFRVFRVFRGSFSAAPMLPSFRNQSSIFLFAVLFAVSPAFLSAADATAKKGGARGFGAVKGAQGQSGQWWHEIDTGPFISDTIRIGRDGPVLALKGIAIKLGPARDPSVVFDTALLAWRTGFDGVLTLEGTAWSGTHGGSSFVPGTDGSLFFQGFDGLGVAVNGDWTDVRDPKSGPLPHHVARYRGLFRHGNQIVLHYTVGGVNVLESPALETVSGVRAITRTVNIDATPTADLELLVRDVVPTTNVRMKRDVQ